VSLSAPGLPDLQKIVLEKDGVHIAAKFNKGKNDARTPVNACFSFCGRATTGLFQFSGDFHATVQFFRRQVTRTGAGRWDLMGNFWRDRGPTLRAGWRRRGALLTTQIIIIIINNIFYDNEDVIT
jgi:hypothetical protein